MGGYTQPAQTNVGLMQDAALLRPALAGMGSGRTSFTGRAVYASLVLTATGPRVLEFNCRFSEPECCLICRQSLKPGELELDYLVRMFSFAGDTVLDPFAGTGTTNVAADGNAAQKQCLTRHATDALAAARARGRRAGHVAVWQERDIRHSSTERVPGPAPSAFDLGRA